MTVRRTRPSSAAPAVAEALPAWGAFKVLRPLPGGNRGRAFLVARTTAGGGPTEPAGERFVAKTTGREPGAVAWAAAVAQRARSSGLAASGYLPTPDGRWVVGGVTLQPFLDGRPATVAERRAALALLRAFHAATAGTRQRPGFASSAALLRRRRGGDVDLDAMPEGLVRACRDAWRPFRDRRRTAIHGDLNADNVLRGTDGRIVLLDWDECRVDLPLFDEAAWMDEENRDEGDRDEGDRSASGRGRPDAQTVCSGGARRTLAADAARRARIAWEVATCWTLEPQYARRLARALGWADG